ncbi:MAG: cytochrome c biogenesis protein CcsA [Propionibacteriaceae bacterium]|nr:cytochrome c biogenesis protein CcsA [Propionibacteriaceae bacterium]
MAALAQYCLIGTLVFIVIALVMNLVVVASQNRVTRKVVAAPKADEEEPELELVGATTAKATTAKAAATTKVPAAAKTTTKATSTKPVPAATKVAAAEAVKAAPAATAKVEPHGTSLSVGSLATGFTVVAWLLVTVYLIARWAQAGHFPLINMNGYACGLVWVILAAALIAFWRFRVRLISVVALCVAAIMTIYATTVEFAADPLVPALQNSVLLTLHVGFAIVGSGGACVAFAGAVMYLLQPHIPRLKTSRATFDEISYKGAVVTFPLWTIMVLFGALWANTAWGTYWSWDPKETAALVTWLIYAAYLHARVVGGWRGTRSAWLQVLAFVAVLFTLFGNYFFGGLHSYA